MMADPGTSTNGSEGVPGHLGRRPDWFFPNETSSASTSAVKTASPGATLQSTSWVNHSNANETTAWLDATPGPHLPPCVQIVLAVVVSCLVLLTVFGNLLVIASFCRFKHLRGYTQYFIISLSVADLLVGCVGMPLYGLEFILGYWVFGELTCDIFVFCDHAFSHFSIVSAVVISLDRYVAVTRPFLHRRRWRTKRNAAILIFLSYAIPTLIWLPITLLWPVFTGAGSQLNGVCQPQYLESLVVSILAPILFFWFPVLLVTVLYIRLFKSIKETLKTRRQWDAKAQRGARSIASRVSVNYTKDVAVAAAKRSDQVARPTEESPTQADPPSSHATPCLKDSQDDGSVATPPDVIIKSPGIARGERPLPAGAQRREDGAAISERTPTFRTLDVSDLPRQATPASHAQPAETPRPDGEVQDRCKPASLPDSSRSYERRARIENTRAARTLGCIITALIIAWLPWAVLVLVINVCTDCLPQSLYAASVFLGYTNSTLNPFCYAISDRRFRRAFRAILRLSCKETSPSHSLSKQK